MADTFAALDMPWQVVGGLAARAWGALRPLVDLDVYVPDRAALDRLAAAVADDLVRPPEPHEGPHWRLVYLRADRRGWPFEAAAADGAWLRGGPGDPWTPAEVRFDASETRSVEGIAMPVMPLERLIAYKRLLGRPVDRIDLAHLERIPRSE